MFGAWLALHYEVSTVVFTSDKLRTDILCKQDDNIDDESQFNAIIADVGAIVESTSRMYLVFGSHETYEVACLGSSHVNPSKKQVGRTRLLEYPNLPR